MRLTSKSAPESVLCWWSIFIFKESKVIPDVGPRFLAWIFINFFLVVGLVFHTQSFVDIVLIVLYSGFLGYENNMSINEYLYVYTGQGSVESAKA